jgi:hypothetical protein
MKRIVQVSVIVLLITLTSPGMASAGTTADAGWGIGSVLATCIYSPIKLTYATLGGVTGGLAYLLTGFDSRIATTIWARSLRGTYVITPTMLKGDEQIRFVGY